MVKEAHTIVFDLFYGLTGQKIAQLWDRVVAFIGDNFPSDTIKHVKDDGFGMIHAFQES